jgi:outer membrane protein assembly factor BamB
LFLIEARYRPIKAKLVFSGIGGNQIAAVDLETFELSVFRDLKALRGSMGTITFADGRDYVRLSKKIYSFSANSEEVKLVASLPEGNIVGVVVVGARLVVAVNGGFLYQIDLETGKVSQLGGKIKWVENVMLLDTPGD